MRFPDYEASHITPQKTLLKKLNEILKFLRTETNEKQYKHNITLKYTAYNGNAVLLRFSIISKESNAFSIYNLSEETLNKINNEINGRCCLYIKNVSVRDFRLIYNIYYANNTPYLNTTKFFTSDYPVLIPIGSIQTSDNIKFEDEVEEL